jgi:uncharacterized protein (TIGR02246 family)
MSEEDQIRALDQSGARAVLAADAAALDDLYSPDHLLHAPPNNAVMTKSDVLNAVRAARFGYDSFDRTTEHVTVHGDIAVSMGGEIVMPHGRHPKAGQVVNRRYTHVWRNEDGRWRLLIRHANEVAQR